MRPSWAARSQQSRKAPPAAPRSGAVPSTPARPAPRSRILARFKEGSGSVGLRGAGRRHGENGTGRDRGRIGPPVRTRRRSAPGPSGGTGVRGAGSRGPGRPCASPPPPPPPGPGRRAPHSARQSLTTASSPAPAPPSHFPPATAAAAAALGMIHRGGRDGGLPQP